MKTPRISIRPRHLKIIGSFSLLMVFAFMTSGLHAQNTERTVSGIVTTYDGPLPYASVVLKGSMTTVTTDDDGAFTFPKKLKEHDVLIITSMAYDSYEVTIDSDTTLSRRT